MRGRSELPPETSALPPHLRRRLLYHSYIHFFVFCTFALFVLGRLGANSQSFKRASSKTRSPLSRYRLRWEPPCPIVCRISDHLHSSAGSRSETLPLLPTPLGRRRCHPCSLRHSAPRGGEEKTPLLNGRGRRFGKMLRLSACSPQLSSADTKRKRLKFKVSASC